MSKKLTIDNFLATVSFADIEQLMGKREYKKFLKWMEGQTCGGTGVYRHDLDRYLKGLPVVD